MEKIFELLNQALQEARNLIGEYRAKLSDVVVREELAVARDAEAVAKLSGLAAREAAIVPIENLNKAHKELDAKAMRIETGLTSLAAEKQKFEAYRSAMQQKLDNEAKENRAGADENTRARAALQSEVKKQVQAIVDRMKG